MKTLFLLLGLLLLPCCSDDEAVPGEDSGQPGDSAPVQDKAAADTGGSDMKFSDLSAPDKMVFDRGQTDSGGVDKGAGKCSIPQCGQSQCGTCTCVWTCGVAKYQVTCPANANPVTCTCKKDGAEVGTCKTPFGPNAAACKANCCKFPQ
jgi:hypothetical protein